MQSTNYTTAHASTVYFSMVRLAPAITYSITCLKRASLDEEGLHPSWSHLYSMLLHVYPRIVDPRPVVQPLVHRTIRSISICRRRYLRKERVITRMLLMGQTGL